MKRSLLCGDISTLPQQFTELVRDAIVYDSSCSPAARVFFIDKDSGFYLKKSAKGSLKTEAELTSYFHGIGLGAEVLGYISDENDWLLTRSICGEDCTLERYLNEPERLAALLGETLRKLHETAFEGCPVQDRMTDYFALAEKNYRTGNYDKSQFPDSFGFTSPEEAWSFAEEHRHQLSKDTLIHGDYCLPNIILDDFKFSGFIDLGNGGVGDRHIDLFWGLWSLWFNLKTDKYGDVFLDAYGRDAVSMDNLKIISAYEVFG